jgi:hypothetical protein
LGQKRGCGGQGQNDQSALHGKQIARQGAACNWTHHAGGFRLMSCDGDERCASFGAGPVPAM